MSMDPCLRSTRSRRRIVAQVCCHGNVAMVSKNVDHCKKIVALGFPGAMETGMETRTPAIVDLGAEAAKLTALLDVTPQPAAGKRRGRGTQLSSYREGILFLGASAGTGPGHWETHPEDEMVHILE